MTGGKCANNYDAGISLGADGTASVGVLRESVAEYLYPLYADRGPAKVTTRSPAGVLA